MASSEKPTPRPCPLAVPAGKGCVLVLTEAKYVNGVKRGKVWQRSAARHKRQRGCGDA